MSSAANSTATDSQPTSSGSDGSAPPPAATTTTTASTAPATAGTSAPAASSSSTSPSAVASPDTSTSQAPGAGGESDGKSSTDAAGASTTGNAPGSSDSKAADEKAHAEGKSSKSARINLEPDFQPTRIASEYQSAEANEQDIQKTLNELWAYGNENLESFHAAIKNLTELGTANGQTMSAAQIEAIQKATESVDRFKEGFKTMAVSQLRAADTIGEMKTAKQELERRMDAEFQNGLTDLSKTLQVMAPQMSPYLAKFQEFFGAKAHPAVREFVHSLASVTKVTAPVADTFQARIQKYKEQEQQTLAQAKAMASRPVEARASADAEGLAAGIAQDTPTNPATTLDAKLANASGMSAATAADPTSINAGGAAAAAAAASGGMALNPPQTGDDRAVTRAMAAAILGQHFSKAPQLGNLAQLAAENTFQSRMMHSAKSVSDPSGPGSMRMPFSIGRTSLVASQASVNSGNNLSFQDVWKATLEQRFQEEKAQQIKQEEQRRAEAVHTSQAASSTPAAQPNTTGQDIDAQIMKLLAQKAAGMTPQQLAKEYSAIAQEGQQQQQPLVESAAAASGSSGFSQPHGPPSLAHFQTMPRREPQTNITAHPMSSVFGLGSLGDLKTRSDISSRLTPMSWNTGSKRPIESRASAGDDDAPMWRTAPFGGGYVGAKRQRTSSTAEDVEESSETKTFNNFFVNRNNQAPPL